MAKDLIARLRTENATLGDDINGYEPPHIQLEAANALEAQARRIAELEAALKLMIDTQDEWEKGVSKVIGKQPSVFNRAIDTARAVLDEN